MGKNENLPPGDPASWRTSPEQNAACRARIASRVGRARHFGGVLDETAVLELWDMLGIAPAVAAP